MVGTDKVNKPEDLVDMPEFPDGTNSALSRKLTAKIWNKYHDKKDDAGVSFKTCIFSGCKNTDSGIGVYAGSHSSYTKFSDLFDPVIEEYHGHKKGAKHVSNMDASKLNCPALKPEQEALIKSTRIRVGRNLKDFPLGPGVSDEQRGEIMKKVVSACETFEGDLKGTFYSLDSLSEEDRN